jgi:hypothetical protein
VLRFPEPGLDDTAAYAGYTTRFYRDAHRNTVQLYLERQTGRAVHLFANGENESIGFSIRTADGRSAPVDWDGDVARVSRTARASRLSYVVRSPSAVLHIGRFVLGSMRIERDVQYFKADRKAFTDPPYALAEFEALAKTIGALSAGAQREALTTLRAGSLAALQRRLRPQLATRTGAPTIDVWQASLDGLDTMGVTFAVLDGGTVGAASPGELVLRARAGAPLRVQITVRTTGRALAPLTRREIFTPEFLQWAGRQARAGDDRRARWIERQIAGVELLSSREKLMAGLPTYATYFGRDMLVSALMMQPIWRAEMNEFVIGAAWRKLAPNGEVSHEEALGGQAMREAASEYVALQARADTMRDARGADSLRTRAREVLRTRRVTRENYHMVDDEYQLPLLIARYLDDPRLSAARKRAFLLGTDGGANRLSHLLAQLSVVASRTAAYAADPVVRHLVSFAPRDATADVFPGEPRWFAQSWRDSGAGYGNGRYAMDVNAIYVPQALAAMERILAALRRLGIPGAMQAALRPLVASTSGSAAVLARYVSDSASLSAAVRTWQSAERHFAVRFTPEQTRHAVSARLAALPTEEARFWRGVPATSTGIAFAALALDANGQSVTVANTDPATRLFLDGLMGTPSVSGAAREALQRDVSLFARPYPEGLLMPGVGVVVANDAYATPTVWTAFEADPYHGPRVVWGREVNLFLLGVASHLPLLERDPALSGLLRRTADAVREAVRASGFHSELWSYGVTDGRVQPRRYGSGADVQLWSTTDLAVQYVWSRLTP